MQGYTLLGLSGKKALDKECTKFLLIRSEHISLCSKGPCSRVDFVAVDACWK